MASALTIPVGTMTSTAEPVAQVVQIGMLAWFCTKLA
jgi:hypothetical protein